MADEMGGFSSWRRDGAPIGGQALQPPEGRCAAIRSSGAMPGSRAGRPHGVLDNELAFRGIRQTRMGGSVGVLGLPSRRWPRSVQRTHPRGRGRYPLVLAERTVAGHGDVRRPVEGGWLRETRRDGVGILVSASWLPLLRMDARRTLCAETRAGGHARSRSTERRTTATPRVTIWVSALLDALQKDPK